MKRSNKKWVIQFQQAFRCIDGYAQMPQMRSFGQFCQNSAKEAFKQKNKSKNIIIEGMLRLVFESDYHNVNRKVTYKELTSIVRQAFPNASPNFSIYFEHPHKKQIELTCQQDLKVIYEGSDRIATVTIVNEQSPQLLQVDSSSDEQAEVIEDVNQNQANKKKPLKHPQIDIDIIKMQVQNKIKELIPQISANVLNYLRFQASSINKIQNSVVHFGTICKRCTTQPIVGVRYKCSVCRDFDLCQSCEQKGQHKHPFLKIRSPEKAPESFLVITSEIIPPERIHPNQIWESNISKDFNTFTCAKYIQDILLIEFAKTLQFTGQYSSHTKKKVRNKSSKRIL